MRRLRLPAAGLLAVGLVTALALWVGEAERPGAPVAASPGDVGGPGDGAGGPLVPEKAPALGAGAGRMSVRLEPARTETGVEEGSAREPPPALAGRVVDRAGEGVAGAAVLAAKGTSWLAVPLDVELDGFEGWIERRETETDAGGAFSFSEALPPGPLSLAVRARGFAPLYLDGIQAPPPADLGELTLEPGVRLSGRVVDASGRGIPGVQLLQAVERGANDGRADLPGRGVLLATTVDDGAFVVGWLGPGPWSLLLDGPQHVVCRVSGHTQEPGEEQSNLVFVLKEGASLRGVVHGRPPELVGRLRIEARLELAPGGPPTDAVPRTRRAPVDRDGGFLLSGLEPRAVYVLGAWQEAGDPPVWRPSQSVEPVVAQPGTLAELRYDPPASFVLALVDAETGAPVADFVLWAGYGGRLRALGEAGSGPVLRHHPGGRARFEGLGLDPGGRGAQLLVRAAGYRDHWSDVVLRRGEELDLGVIALERAPAVRVTVLDAETSEPVGGARAVLVADDQQDRRWLLQLARKASWSRRDLPFGVTDDSGLAVLAAPESTPWQLVVLAEGYLPSAPVGVLVQGGQDVECTVSLSRGANVEVCVVSPEGRTLPGAKVQHHYEGDSAFDWLEAPGTSGPDGVVRYGPLPPGSHAFRVQADRGHAVRVSDDDPSWTRVRVADGDALALELAGPERGELVGVVTKAGRPLAGARLTLRPDRGRAPGERWFWYEGEVAYAATSDRRGAYALGDVEYGAWVLTVTHPERHMPQHFAVEVAGARTIFDAELQVAVVAGTVRDPDGRPLAGLEVRAERVDDDGSWIGGSMTLVEDDRGLVRSEWRASPLLVVRTDEAGRFRLEGVATGEPIRVSAMGPFVVEGSTETGLPASGGVREGVDLVLEPAGELLVTMLAADDWAHRVEAILVDAPENTDAIRTEGLGRSRPTRLSSCPVGTWRLTVQRWGDGEWITVTQAEAEVLPGSRTSVTVTVP